MAVTFAVTTVQEAVVLLVDVYMTFFRDQNDDKLHTSPSSQLY